MGYNRQRLANLIRAERKRARLSIREAAREVQISPATLSRIERKGPASGESLFRLMIWLGIPLSELAGPEQMHGLLPEDTVSQEALPPTDVSAVRLHLRAVRHLDSRTTEALAEAFRCVATLLESRQEAGQ